MEAQEGIGSDQTEGLTGTTDPLWTWSDPSFLMDWKVLLKEKNEGLRGPPYRTEHPVHS